MTTKKKATGPPQPAAPTQAELDAELLRILRPVALTIIGADRERTRRHLQGGSWTLAGMVEEFGSLAFWMPDFWMMLRDTYTQASADPKHVAETFPEKDYVADLERWRASFDESRTELERLHKVLLGTRALGRTKGKPAKDYAARLAMVEAKAAELRAKGEKKVIGKARAIVAKAENVMPGTLRKDPKRAKRGK